MELTSLYYFKVVAEVENITKAAESLYISQPALSKSIAKLEKSLGVSLFERRRGRLNLSPMGKVYYEYVSNAFSVLQQGERRLEELKRNSGDRVSVASPVSALLHGLVHDFVASHTTENIQINQFLFSQDVLETKLLMGELDFAITPITVENNEIEQTKLMEEEVFAVVSRAHPLAARQYVALAELAEEKFLVDESSFDIKIVRINCGLVNFDPHVLLCSNESHLIYAALRDNLGVALIPGNQLQDPELTGVKALRLTDVELVRMISVAKRRDRIFSENAALLYNHAIRYYQTLGRQLAAQYAAEFPENDFPGRKRLGINELKPENLPIHAGPFSERRGPFE
jgi:DNA-binding transcriptional LysR family regulator